MKNIKLYLSNKKKEFLNNIIEWLKYVLIQINKSGIRSTNYYYIYKNLTKQYIKNIDDFDWPKMTDNVSEAMDFQFWYRDLVLFKLNLGIDKEEKYRWKKFIKLEGVISGSNLSVIMNQLDINKQASSTKILYQKESEQSLNDIDDMDVSSLD